MTNARNVSYNGNLETTKTTATRTPKRFAHLPMKKKGVFHDLNLSFLYIFCIFGSRPRSMNDIKLPVRSHEGDARNLRQNVLIFLSVSGTYMPL